MPQSLSSVLVHAVFSTKERKPWIAPEIKPDLHSYLARMLNTTECPCLTLNTATDHLHVLFNLSRTATVADVSGRMKKRSSKWIKEKWPELERFFWQGGYGAFSVSQSRVLQVRRYIETQEAHHRHRTFQEEFRELLRRHSVPDDERYVWD